MKENKIKIVIYLSLMLVFVGIAVIIMMLFHKPENPDDIHTPITDSYKFSSIYDINEYQTIYNCLRNYYTKINDNQNNALNLLFEEYKTNNKITINNINSFVEKKYNSFGYEIIELQKYYNPYFSFYFVKGEYKLESLDDVLEKIIVQDIVIVDIIQNSYAILPVLDANENFESIIDVYQFYNYSKNINKNGYNELQTIDVSQYNEVTMYFNEIIKNLVTDCNQAYALIGNDTKTKYSTLNDFRKLCDYYKSENISPTIMNYKIESKEGKKNITIIDNYSIQYNLIINSVKDYIVEIYN